MKESPTPNSLNPSRWNCDHRNYLIQFALNKVDDYQIAEDLVQEVFLAAWMARDRFRGECSEKSFLTRILRNKIIDYYRFRGRRPLVSASQLESGAHEEINHWLENKADERTDLNPSNVGERVDFMAHLNKAVDELPEKMGKAFRMWQINDCSTQEVTRTLNISSNNLWVLVHRAKKALSEELSSEWKGESFGTVFRHLAKEI